MDKLAKTFLDLLMCSKILEYIGGNEFLQELIISIVVVLINFLILPLLKKIISKIKWLNEDEKAKLKEETEKIAEEVTDKLDKKDK